MAYHLLTSNTWGEIPSTRLFSDLLNWAAAQPGASDGAFEQVFLVRPADCQYRIGGSHPLQVAPLIEQLEALTGFPISARLEAPLREWLRMARAARRLKKPLQFV